MTIQTTAEGVLRWRRATEPADELDAAMDFVLHVQVFRTGCSVDALTLSSRQDRVSETLKAAIVGVILRHFENQDVAVASWTEPTPHAGG